MNNNLTKKGGRPPPEVSQAACESEKCSRLARKRLAGVKNAPDWLASGLRE